MGDRISIVKLRMLAEISTDDSVSQDDFDAICDVLPALVEAIEAAHAHVVARRDRLSSGWPSLLNALARFDFEA